MARKKKCSVCGKVKLLVEMAPIGLKGAPEYKRRSYCKACKHKKNPSSLLRRKIDRIRSMAKKRNISFSLTTDHIRKLLSCLCSYCGSKTRPSIDRKDSRIGYTDENCVSACFRCNTLKGDMPYAAWECFIPSVREAETKGLFGNWNGRVFPHR